MLHAAQSGNMDGEEEGHVVLEGKLLYAVILVGLIKTAVAIKHLKLVLNVLVHG